MCKYLPKIQTVYPIVVLFVIPIVTNKHYFIELNKPQANKKLTTATNNEYLWHSNCTENQVFLGFRFNLLKLLPKFFCSIEYESNEKLRMLGLVFPIKNKHREIIGLNNTLTSKKCLNAIHALISINMYMALRQHNIKTP